MTPPPGARASRPHKAWHSFACLRHFDQPGTAPLLLFRSADAVPANRIAACRIANEAQRSPSGEGCRLPAASIARLARRGISGQSGAPRRRTLFKDTRCGRPGAGGEGGWQGQDAGGTPALPEDAVRLGGGRAPDGRILKNLTCTRWAPGALSRRASWSRIPILTSSEREPNG